MTEAKAVKKAFSILKRELSTEEYIEFIRAMLPKFPEDSTKLLRELTKDLSLEEVFEEVQKREKRTA